MTMRESTRWNLYMFTSNLNSNEKVNDLQSFEWQNSMNNFFVIVNIPLLSSLLFISIFGCICKHTKTQFALKTDENIFPADKKIQFEVLVHSKWWFTKSDALWFECQWFIHGFKFLGLFWSICIKNFNLWL